MEKYVLEALFSLGDAEAALSRMRERYKEMVASPLTTLWEHWQPKRHTSFNHAWTGGPLSLLPREVVGLAPESPGWRTCSVTPRLGDLEWASASLETVRGTASVEIRRAGGKLLLEIENPCEVLWASVGTERQEISTGKHSLTFPLDP